MLCGGRRMAGAELPAPTVSETRVLASLALSSALSAFLGLLLVLFSARSPTSNDQVVKNSYTERVGKYLLKLLHNALQSIISCICLAKVEIRRILRV